MRITSAYILISWFVCSVCHCSSFLLTSCFWVFVFPLFHFSDESMKQQNPSLRVLVMNPSMRITFTLVKVPVPSLVLFFLKGIIMRNGCGLSVQKKKDWFYWRTLIPLDSKSPNFNQRGIHNSMLVAWIINALDVSVRCAISW